MSTTVKAASNGGTSKESPAEVRDYGLPKLRREEGKALISLASEAVSQTASVTHQLHGWVYARGGEFDPARCTVLLEEVLACWEAADHYLRMLDSTLADYDPQAGSPAPF